MNIPQIVVLLFGVTAWSCGKIAENHNNKVTPKNNSTTEATPVEGTVIKHEFFKENIQLTGTVLAVEKVIITSEINGRISSINFKEGQYVSKGTILVKINDDEIKANLRKAIANIEYFKNEWERKKLLLDKKAISIEEVDRLQNQLDLALAEKDLLQAQLDKYSILAPFSGKIGIRSISVGSMVTPGLEITRLYQTDPILIEFSVPEKYAGLIKENMGFTFKAEGNDRVFNAKISVVDPEVDLETRTLRVRGICPNPRNELKSGAFVTIDLNIREMNNAILIPASAVSSDIHGAKVLIIKDGIIQVKYIQIGTRTEESVLIKGGLSPGDTLITSGLLQLKPGSPAILKP